jgi:adenylate cyclase, class 1
MPILEEIHKNRELFLRFNEVKYKNFQQLIGNPGIRRVVNSIPILLSVNHKRLPGFIEGDVPCGITGFKPDSEAVKYLQGRFYVRDIGLRTADPFIEMMAVMGSVGTIAYTRDSDFDYWVCIDRRNVPPEKIDLFQKKVDAVQSWAMKEIDIEVSIFINDISNIKENIFAENREEAFGTIIGAVLKDEFFRSSIIIAGKVPFWWVLPRFVKDSEYEALYREISDEDRKNIFVDLGNLYEISKEDFIGAALFLIIKSLGNPFKSIIKLGLLEKYLLGPDNSPLLCQKVKSNILRGNLDNKIIDSYILMFEEVFDYYESAVADAALLKILRQNLYLKINPQLSRYIGVKDRQSLPYKVLVMFGYVKEWGWSGKEIQALDNFERWDYNRTMVFWNLVQKFMLLSYQKIAAQIPAMKLEQKISASDFKLLSGKIKSHFAHDANKIDHYITFKDTPFESMLYVEPAAGSGIDADEWSLLKKYLSEGEAAQSTILKTEKGLVRLLSWTAINQIFNPRFSRLKFQAGYSRVTQNRVLELLERIANLFSGTLSKLKNEFYLRPAFNMSNMVIINFGLENIDAIKTIHHIYETSWGESYIDEYGAGEDIVSILGKVLKEGIISRPKFDDYCVIDTPEPFKKNYKDIEQIFREAYECIVQAKDSRSSCRFLGRLGGKYVTVTRDGGSVSLSSDPDIVKALSRISLNPRSAVAYSFYSSDPRLRILDDIYRMRKKNFISAVFEEAGDYILAYVVNERDNLFMFIKPKKEKEDLIVFLYHFCQNISLKTGGRDSVPRPAPGIHMFQVMVDRFGKISSENITRRCEELYVVKFKSKKGITVRIAKYSTSEPLYSLSAQGGVATEFAPLSSVPGRVETIIRSIASVSRFIADIEITDGLENQIQPGSTPYFFEKYRMELIIDKVKR